MPASPQGVQGVWTLVSTIEGTLLTDGSDGCIRHLNSSAVELHSLRTRLIGEDAQPVLM